MRALALTLETIAGHSSTENKVQAAAAYLASQDSSKVAVAARFLAGTPLPPGSPATRIGRSTMVDIVATFGGAERRALLRRATVLGDLGMAVAEIVEAAPRRHERLPLREVAEKIERLGLVGRDARSRMLQDMLSRATPVEAKYLTKLLLGSMRTGIQANRVEEALALAFDQPLSAVRRAHMLLGDIGAAAELAAVDQLGSVSLRAHRPVRSMLAHPAESTEEVRQLLSGIVIAEHKYDGIRAQWHYDGNTVRVFSRALEDCSHYFPEIRTAPAGLQGEWILDGEVVAWLDGRATSFNTLQRRLGRKEVPLTLLLDAPVIFLAFDALRAEGEDLIDQPLLERKRLLAGLPVEGAVQRAPWEPIAPDEDLLPSFETALAAGDEGAVYKDPDSRYQPGSRGRSWIKLKRPLGVLDVVVTGAEWGRGKRAGMLSDLLFAVRGPEGLVDAGRAYSGLTDQEIRRLTEHFREHTISTIDNVRRVTPNVVMEVAFDDVRPSDRHPAGFALRFPRIVRLRDDLGPDDVSTLEDLRNFFDEARVPRVERG
jgi:DNA ligase-1